MRLDNWRKNTILFFICIGAVFRIWFVYFNPAPGFAQLRGDELGYDNCANNFLAWISGPEAMRPPVYIFFVKIWYILASLFQVDKIKLVFLAQEMLNIVTLVLLLMVSDMIFSKNKGKDSIKTIIVFMFLLYFPYVNANAVMLREGLNCFFVVLFVLLLLKYHAVLELISQSHIVVDGNASRLSRFYLLFFAFVFSLAYLNREENVLFGFFVLLVFGFFAWIKRKKEYQRAIIFLVIMLYMFNYPWVIRNLINAHKNIFLSSLGGINICMGLMCEFPISDDLRCPYLTEMFGLYSAKLKELGDSGAIKFFFEEMVSNYTVEQILKFYLNKIINLFKEPVILSNFYVHINFFMISPAFQKLLHSIYLCLFILALPLILIKRKKISVWVVYVFFFFILKIFASLISFGSPRAGFTLTPFIILFAAFSVYCLMDLIRFGFLFLINMTRMG
ncbi:MAG: hypothetical protein HY810_02295 [Candidatus Omnitrophica bacterium]|nr:hypothetical protein [Candidatus Omnitrophota bacterium]